MKQNDEFLLSYMKEHFAYQQDGFFVLVKKQYAGSKLDEKVGWLQPNGYWRISIKRKFYQAHGLVWLFHKGEMPKYEVDHINGNKADNRIENLRDISHKHNTQNVRLPRSKNKTGFLGVTKSIKKGLFSATIQVDGKTKILGHYSNPLDAHAKYVEAKFQHHEGFVL